MVLRLNLGCGNGFRDGFVNVDFKPGLVVDVVQDLNDDTWIWSDNSVDEIVAYHVCEHVVDPVHFINECHRILKPNGILSVRLPVRNYGLCHFRGHHTKGYFYAVTDDGFRNLQNIKLFDLKFEKPNCRSVKNLFVKFRNWFLDLFADEWIYCLEKV